MHDDSKLVLARIDRLMAQRLAPSKYRAKAPVEITAWNAPGEPIPFVEAVKNTFSPIANGDAWGRPWGTTWFHVRGEVPKDWEGEGPWELIADIGFNDTQTGFQCEGMAYTPQGVIIKAVEPHNRYITLPQTEGQVDLYLEAASNPDVINEWTFVPTELGRWQEDNNDPIYHLTEIALGLRDQEVVELYADIETLRGLVDVLPETSPRRGLIIGALAEVLRLVDPDDVSGTAAAGRAALAGALEKPATASSHKVLAVGHAHIDSAWLWPIRETARKVARTFSNALDLMDKNEDFVFAASSAQQYYWIKEQYPELYERVKARIAEGRFVPVGGMWVESDTNLPGGEAMVRQFVVGSAFFRNEFGIEAPEVWLPDSFGYSPALPQIIKLAGARWFLTQKISWNQVNKMPHHTFWWEGIDGTRVFSHFPPVDTYMSDLSAKDLQLAEDQYAEKAIEGTSLVPYGYGDGGGGPTREMLAYAERKQDLEGSPRVTLGSPEDFFTTAEREYPNPPVWSGELYLELHRGTFTSQARTKRGNRRSESLLREAELWATTAALRASMEYPKEELDAAWRTVLLNQFHDILPGTSIGWVHDQVEEQYAKVERDLQDVIDRSVKALIDEVPGEEVLVLNAGPFEVDDVPALGALTADSGAEGPGGSATETIKVTESGDGIQITTPVMRVDIAPDGTISSLYDVIEERETVPEGSAANQLQLFRDTPSEWDAWDIDLIDRLTKKELVTVEKIEVTERKPDSVTVTVERQFGNSKVTQDIRVNSTSKHVDIRTEVTWHEREKMLKLAFPFDVRAERSTSETQFGHIHRPLHSNTSWDVARFETPAHRWVHVGEPDYGFGIANDSVYGYDFGRETRDDGGTTTQVRLSLLRAPLYPDPEADQGAHEFNIRVRLDADIEDTVKDGYALNLPLREISGVGSAAIAPLISVDNEAVVVESVKMAEDGSGDVIVRLYEALGTRAKATVRADFEVAGVEKVNLHEFAVEDPAALTGTTSSPLSSGGDGGVLADIHLRPLQIATLRFGRK